MGVVVAESALNGQAMAMPMIRQPTRRHPGAHALEMNAIVTAFGSADQRGKGAVWTGASATRTDAIHIGMGPPLTRAATLRLFDETVRALCPSSM